MTTNKERQSAFKARMREAGRTQVTVWVTDAQKAALKDWLARDEAGDPMSAPVITSNEPKAPVLTPADTSRDQNWIFRHIQAWPDNGMEGLLALIELQRNNTNMKDIKDELQNANLDQLRLDTAAILARDILTEATGKHSSVDNLLRKKEDQYLGICQSGKWKHTVARLGNGQR